jgi:hypothetical protein
VYLAKLGMLLMFDTSEFFSKWRQTFLRDNSKKRETAHLIDISKQRKVKVKVEDAML